MSAALGSAAASVVPLTCSSGRPTPRPDTTGGDRHDGNLGAGGGVSKGCSGACAFLAVVGRVPALALPHRNTIEIRGVAVQRIGCGERGLRLRRDVAVISRAEPDDGEVSAHA